MTKKQKATKANVKKSNRLAKVKKEVNRRHGIMAEAEEAADEAAEMATPMKPFNEYVEDLLKAPGEEAGDPKRQGNGKTIVVPKNIEDAKKQSDLIEA